MTYEEFKDLFKGADKKYNPVLFFQNEKAYSFMAIVRRKALGYSSTIWYFTNVDKFALKHERPNENKEPVMVEKDFVLDYITYLRRP